MERSCNKKGIAWLTVREDDGSDETIAIATTCKTKACLACQPKLTSLFRMIVEYGLRSSIQHRFYFTTFTYRAGKNLQRDVESVKADWRKMLLWFSTAFPTMVKWIRVIELTKAMQPHLHVIIGFSHGNERAACETKARYDAEWLSRSCDCLEHRLSAAWLNIVGDSYVVDCKEIGSASWAASYLSKYVAKAFIHSEAFVALGFKRSWSRSRTWGVERLQLATTKQGGWHRVEFTAGTSTSAYPREGSAAWWLKSTEQHPLRARVGTELALELGHRYEDEAALAKYKQLLEGLRNASRKAHNDARLSTSRPG